ncbi:MAG TPA: primosomal protein N' [Solirubrobacteraceae bacterium]|nr:primosomal protein N' [Solirubrobacteraceae bacterium]
MSSAIAQVEPLTTTRALRGPFDYRLPEELRDGAVKVGSMLVVPFGRREVLGVVTGLSERSEVADEKLLAPLRAPDEGPPALPVDLVVLAEWIAAEYCSTLARALRLVLPPGVTGGRGALSVRKRRPRAVPRPRHEPVGTLHAEPPPLTAEQREALAEIRAALDSAGAESDASGAGGHRLLLHGITGSGKTEVYLRAAACALEGGRGAIVLVPEIALTPQIVGRFVGRFGETVAVLHSRLTPAQRREEWRRLRAGEARVCVGPRSAVFAPIERLGLIVVDEEHESSYKHEGDPRYDAREVAAKRASLQGALLLLGSATPRPESRHMLPRVSLGQRVDGRPLPPVEVLDMREQSHGLHPHTAQALAEVRRHSGKAIVLLNRRGWSNFLSCRSCGKVWSCPQCDVALVLHRAEGHVACHHCGHRERAPARCGCGSTAVARHGAGTERVQHDLQAALGDGERFPIFRLDADVLAGDRRATGGGPPARGTSSTRARTAEAGAVGQTEVGALLRRFAAAPAGVLIGTQMVAKGHDFPDVTLGVVLDADCTLRFPDFRAEERTFALIAQLAGRVGRGGEGSVLVQSIDPHARAIAHAARHDSEGFLAGELQRREALSYPPFAHLIRVVCAAQDARRAQAAASAVREGLRERLAPAAASVLGPATLFRLRGRERRVLMIKASDRHAAVGSVGAAVQHAAAGRAHAGVSFSVDVDPQ